MIIAALQRKITEIILKTPCSSYNILGLNTGGKTGRTYFLNSRTNHQKLSPTIQAHLVTITECQVFLCHYHRSRLHIFLLDQILALSLILSQDCYQLGGPFLYSVSVFRYNRSIFFLIIHGVSISILIYLIASSIYLIVTLIRATDEKLSNG